MLISILDKHAPQKIITCPSTPNKSYYTDDIVKQKRKRSKFESTFRNKDTKVNEDNYKGQCKLVNKMLTSFKHKIFLLKYFFL